ncbi:MAG: hypothetical protein SFV22_18835 [Saprospiraceae bacterium]|nr:hypothetical protein [Saprospiraceae bacterium]
MFAQRNTLETGIFALPFKNRTLTLGSVGYYHHLPEKRTLGLRFTYATDALFPNNTSIQHQGYIFDLVHRWTKSSAASGRSRWQFETGISAFLNRVDYHYEGYIDICATGLTNEEINTAFREIDWYTGLASGVHWEREISPSWRLGVGSHLNIYFSVANGWCLLPLPFIRSAYSF